MTRQYRLQTSLSCRKITLKCTASIHNLYWQTTEQTVTVRQTNSRWIFLGFGGVSGLAREGGVVVLVLAGVVSLTWQ